MNIELKKIQVHERMSEETTCFEADLHINGKKAGIAFNEGHGGPTSTRGNSEEGYKLIRDAEAYCQKLPDRVYPDIKGKNNEPLTLKMTLEHYLDDLLEEHLKQKDQLKFDKQTEKDMKKGFLIGIAGKEYGIIKFTHYTLDQLLATEKGLEAIEKVLRDKVKPQLAGGKQLLNTNIPDALLKKLDIPLMRKNVFEENTVPKKSKNKRHRLG